MKCIIYIRTTDISRWNTYMYHLRTPEPKLPPTFRTWLSDEITLDTWVQMIIPMDDLERIYDLLDEYATTVEKLKLT